MLVIVDVSVPILNITVEILDLQNTKVVQESVSPVCLDVYPDV